MITGRITLALALLAVTPLATAQFGKADMMKMATDRMDTIAKALKLSPDQVSKIKPLLESKFTEMGEAKEKYAASDKSDDAKKEATESLKSINTKYNDQITENLTTDQAKQFTNMNKSWKDDLSLKMPKIPKP